MTVKEFLFDLPLYQKVPKEECGDVISFITNNTFRHPEVDGYNPIVQCDSTFELYCGIYNAANNSMGTSSFQISYVSGKRERFDTYEVILACKRYDTLLHFLIHAEYNEDDYRHKDILTISKVGQYPSVADFHIGQVHKYDKVLPKDKMREFTKAIGLAANGIGVGSFVYLRRIFEHLVFEALETAKVENEAFDVNAFVRARMNDKIQMLSGYLPDYLIEQHTIYGILSKGIHELSEDECKEYFSVLKASIEMILDERLEAYQKERRKKEISAALSKITKQMQTES